MVSGLDPLFQRRRLRSELRKAREAAGLKQRDVAPAMDWSLSKLIRIETGAVGISINDLKVLLQLYRVTEPDRVNELLEMARAAKEPAWWSTYREAASSEFLTFLGYESSASIIRNFEPLLMPGLLQTEEYARAALAELVPPVAQDNARLTSQVDALVELRMERQERLSQRSAPPKVFFALDEAVVHRWVGGSDVMRRQLQRLKEALASPEWTIWIVPFSVGLYQRQRGSYVLFEFPADEDEDILYLEGSRGELIIRDDLHETAVYLEAFWRIEQIALKNEDAISLVDHAISRLPVSAPPTISITRSREAAEVPDGNPPEAGSRPRKSRRVREPGATDEPLSES
jgi:transcriptional regulator with XRE-family HTH domain